MRRPDGKPLDRSPTRRAAFCIVVVYVEMKGPHESQQNVFVTEYEKETGNLQVASAANRRLRWEFHTLEFNPNPHFNNAYRGGLSLNLRP